MAMGPAWLGSRAAAVAAATGAADGTALATALTINGAAAAFLSTAARTMEIVTGFSSLAFACETNLAACAGNSGAGTLAKVFLEAVNCELSSADTTDAVERANPSANAPQAVL